MEGENAPCILEMMKILRKIRVVNVLEDSKQHIHDILYTTKSNVKYMNTENCHKSRKSNTEHS